MPAIARAIVTSQRVARSRRGMRAGSDGVVVFGVFGVFGAVLSVESVGGFQVEVEVVEVGRRRQPVGVGVHERRPADQ